MSLQQSITLIVVLVILVAISRQALPVELPNGVNQYQVNAASLPMKGPCIHPVTFISTYYPLYNSKHSSREYDIWMANFFPYVSAPIVLYSPPGETLDRIRELRGDLPMALKLQELWEIPLIKPHRMELENRQHDLDPEKYIHNADLYGIWTAKSWMVEQAMTEDLFHSDYFFRVDVGSWRINPSPNWPDSNKIKQLYAENATKGDEIILASAMLLEGAPSIEGGFFGGSKAAITWWAAKFFHLFDDWIERGIFAGKDQLLMTDIYNRNLHRTILLRSFEIDSKQWNPWFYFQPFFARSAAITENVKRSLHLDVKNVWESNLLSPSSNRQKKMVDT